MILVVRIFQMLHVCALLGNIVVKYLYKRTPRQCLRIADWVYYLCGVSAVVLPFGIVGVLEENAIDSDDRLICIIFVCACFVATGIMILQKIWKVEYNCETLIFRNSLGIRRRYKMDELEYREGKRLCEIRWRGKKIIQWDSLIMNTREEIALSRFLIKKEPLE